MGGPESPSPPAPVHLFDADRPRCHIQPPAGWLNDPNGPIYYKGRYHMFYQYLPNACEWDFGIVWGHAVSSDLVHWDYLPPALVPTPGWVDADGCFSGSCTLDSNGKPIILYTGVRLRSNAECGPLPPQEQDLGMVWIESQCLAVPDDDDDLLIRWKKLESPFLPLPPADLQLTGWRDPFILHPSSHRHHENGFPQQHRMLIGSGLKGQGGTALLYRSESLTKGWELEGLLCSATDTDTGVVWECPLLVPLHPVPAALRPPMPHAPPLWLSQNAIATGSGSSSLHSVDITRKNFGSNVSLGGLDAENGWQRGLQPRRSGDFEGLVGQLRAAVHGMHSSGMPPSSSSYQQDGVPSNTNTVAAGLQRSQREDAEFEFDSSRASPTREGAEADDSNRAFSPELWPTQTSSQVQSPQQEKQQQGDGGAPRVESGLPPRPPANNAAQNLERSYTFEHWTDADGPRPPQGMHRPPSRPPSMLSVGEGNEEEENDTDGKTYEATIGSHVRGNGSDSRGTTTGDDIEDEASVSGIAAVVTSHTVTTATSSSGDGITTKDEKQQLEEDKFAAVLSVLPPVAIKKPPSIDTSDKDNTATGSPNDRNPSGGRSIASSHPSAASISAASIGVGGPSRLDSSASLGDFLAPGGSLLPPAARPWFLFTVSPDAPTNPVLYWTGHVADDGVRFELETAKGPFRLDLGDIMYAPNVCQDDQGRWLLWGWLQERRKVGSYSYAGCLGLPRILHCTDDGRLLQAPVPEVAQLRKGRKYEAKHVTVYPESATPIPGVPGQRLDIECTIERGSALATGLLFRSNEAEAEGGTAIVYDWDKNQLEAIFNVPTSWHPAAAIAARQQQGGGKYDAFEEEEFDPASMLLSPKLGLSRNPSFQNFSPFLEQASHGPFSPSRGHGSTPESPISPDDDSPAIFSPQASEAVVGVPIARSSSSLGLASSAAFASTGTGGLPYVGSYSQFGGAGGGVLSPQSATAAGAGGSLGPSSLPPSGPSGLFHVGSLHRVGSLPRTMSSFRIGGSPRGSQVAAGDGAVDDLDNLLDELAAPMREEPAPAQEPRRVGGPLLMTPGSDRLHLRIIVDHSCVEVFTGTGEVLSTRIYRGEPPEDSPDAGIYFLAFGGAAILERVSAHELGSAWERPLSPEEEQQLSLDQQQQLVQQIGSLKVSDSLASFRSAMTSFTSVSAVGGGRDNSGGSSRRISLEQERSSLDSTPKTSISKIHPADALFDEIILGLDDKGMLTAESSFANN